MLITFFYRIELAPFNVPTRCFGCVVWCGILFKCCAMENGFQRKVLIRALCTKNCNVTRPTQFEGFQAVVPDFNVKNFAKPLVASQMLHLTASIGSMADKSLLFFSFLKPLLVSLIPKARSAICEIGGNCLELFIGRLKGSNQ